LYIIVYIQLHLPISRKCWPHHPQLVLEEPFVVLDQTLSSRFQKQYYSDHEVFPHLVQLYGMLCNWKYVTPRLVLASSRLNLKHFCSNQRTLHNIWNSVFIYFILWTKRMPDKSHVFKRLREGFAVSRRYNKWTLHYITLHFQG
jgi:hypothetical protein